jgi:glycosyltransferase involved in cell wall biosynthesis
VNKLHVVSGTLFFPRGGSAFVTRALTRGLREEGVSVTLISGSRSDRGDLSDARKFYAGIDVHPVDYTAALASADPMSSAGVAGAGPAHPSFEDRPGAADRVFAALDDAAYQRQVDAWTRELRAVDAAGADVLHLHHLTPLNAAAAIAAPDVPIVAQLHGTELLMLEAIEAGAGWPYAAVWAARLRAWAGRAEQLLVAPGNRERALTLLDVDPDRISTLPNGFDPTAFRPLDVDRQTVWRRVLVDEPRGWRPGEEPGSIAYAGADVDALMRGPVILYVGRFTEVKRLTLLLEAFAAARARMAEPASLVLVGGHPGEWEGEHPAETIDRLGLEGVLLAGWHDQSELPELLAASDLLVLPSVRESFGQVIVEAMACGVPAVAAASLGPAQIIENGATGWLFDVDDRAALTAALVDAVNRPSERARRAQLGEQAALERFTWPAIARRLASVLREASGERQLRVRRGVHAAPDPVRRASRRALRRAGAGDAER